MARHGTRNTEHAPTPQQIVPRLLAWFAANARDLPWRRTRDPYAIWVSEIMLQQTQVKTVIPYWERWMRELPTIESLAQADPHKIHKLWEGLGYYTRVRNMQTAAQQMIHWDKQRAESRKQKERARKLRTSNIERRTSSEPRCAFPETFDAILALPGIGRYTAGAIASIAFNQPAPILDGNVIRVLTRLHGIAEDPREKITSARLWKIAEELVTHAKDAKEGIKIKRKITIKKPATPPCSALNQSLMELGALICTPRAPNCAACPVAEHCFARRENCANEFPRPKQRPEVTPRRFIAMIIEQDGKFLVRQRPEGEVNAHLWEFPSVEVTAGIRDLPALPKGLQATKSVCIIKHSITRYRMTTEAWRVNANGDTPHLAGTWRTPAQLHKLPFTSAHRRILERLKTFGAVTS